MACRTGCPTQGCESYAACLRGSGIKVAYCNSANGLDATREKRWRSELQGYRDAKAQGIQPDGTTRQAIDKANRISDLTGRAYGSAA